MAIQDRLNPSRVQFDIGQASVRRVVKPVNITALGTTSTVIYANTSSFDFLIQSLWVSNITGAGVTFDLWSYASGGSAGDAAAIFKGFAIDANSGPVPLCTLSTIRVRLQPGMTLSGAGSSASALNAGGWGVEVLGGEE